MRSHPCESAHSISLIDDREHASVILPPVRHEAKEKRDSRRLPGERQSSGLSCAPELPREPKYAPHQRCATCGGVWAKLDRSDTLCSWTATMIRFQEAAEPVNAMSLSYLSPVSRKTVASSVPRPSVNSREGLVDASEEAELFYPSKTFFHHEVALECVELGLPLIVAKLASGAPDRSEESN
ncbi:hypothetical protein U1Q18_044761 [Sarracenia purpurea var. burkii]